MSVIEIHKDKGSLRFGVVVLLLTGIGFPIYDLVNENIHFGVTLFMSPIYLLCVFLAWLIGKTIKRKIVIASDFLRIDDFKPSILFWEDIRSFSIYKQTRKTKWLVIHFKNNEKYIRNGFLHRLNSFFIGEGIHVCNVTTYDVEEKKLLELLQEALDRYDAQRK